MTTDDFIHDYIPLFFHYQELMWDRYAHELDNDTGCVESDVYTLCHRHRYVLGKSPKSREEAVMQQIIARELVERHPLVARLRNRLDSWSNYNASNLTRAELAMAMKPDVLNLMEHRNRLAQDLGYVSYPALALKSSDTEELNVRDVLRGFLSRNLPRAKDLIKHHGLTTENGYPRLRQLGGSTPGTSRSPLELATDLAGLLGLSQLLSHVSLHVLESGFGYTGAIAVPGDVRILTRPITSLQEQATQYHELGHALAHAANTGPGLFKTWTSLSDETMGVLMERLASRLVFTEEQSQLVADISLIENVRCAVSSLFELDLWSSPERAEELYAEHYGKLGLAISEPALWALDTFRSIDPVYVHNYVLGAMIADRIITHLEALFCVRTEQYGPWLEQEMYQCGRQEPLPAKLKRLGIDLSDWPTDQGHSRSERS